MLLAGVVDLQRSRRMDKTQRSPGTLIRGRMVSGEERLTYPRAGDQWAAEDPTLA